MYSVAAIFKVTQGHWVWGVRFAAALSAMIGLALTITLARRYLRPGAALFAAALMAGSFWFLLAGRLGVESISLLPTALALIYFLARGLRRGSLGMFALAGFMGGVANYTYLASRTLYALPVLMFAIEVVYLVLARRQRQTQLHRKRLIGLLLALGVMLLVSSPLLIYLQTHPGLADNRIRELSGPLMSATHGDFAPLARNLLDALRSIGWGGSNALPYQYSVPGRAALQPVWVVLLLVGLVLTAIRLGDACEALLLAALVLGVGPNLATGGDALEMRAIYALPLLFILVARGGDACWSAARRWLKSKADRKPRYGLAIRSLSVVLLVVLLVWHWADNADAYFNRWASAEQTQRIYNADLRLAQEFVDAHAGDDDVFIGDDRLMALDALTYTWYEPARSDVNWYRLPGDPPVPGARAATYLGPTTSAVPPVLRYLIAAGAESDVLHDAQGRPSMWHVRATPELLTAVEQRANVQPLESPLEYENTLRLDGVGWEEDATGARLLTRWTALGLWPRPTDPGMPLLEPKLSLALVDDTGFTWVHVDTKSDLPVHNMLAGQQLLELTSFGLPSDMPPGKYGVRIVLYDDKAGSLKMRRDGPLFATAPIVATLTVPARPLADPPAPPYTMHSAGGDALRALGQWEPPETLLAEAVTDVHVTWQAQREVRTANMSFRVTGRDRNGAVLWTQTEPAGNGLPPVWEAGRALRLIHQLRPAGIPEGQTAAQVTLCAESEGTTLGCADLPATTVVNLPVVLALKQQPRNPLDARWDDTLSLAGYDIDRQGRDWTLTLYWKAGVAPGAPLKRFVHVMDDNNRILAQSDVPLEKQGLPVTFWQSGEYVPDQVHLVVPDDTGANDICVGVYDAASEQRMPVTSDGGPPLPDSQLCFR